MKKMFLCALGMLFWSSVSWTMDTSGMDIVAANTQQGAIGNGPPDISGIGHCFNRRVCASCTAALVALILWVWGVYGPSQRIVS